VAFATLLGTFTTFPCSLGGVFHFLIEMSLTKTESSVVVIASQNSKPNLEMEQVPSSKPKTTTELSVLVKLISMRK
jgi:hypothetical protein